MKISGGKKRKAGRSLGPKRRKTNSFSNTAFKSPAIQTGKTVERKWVDLALSGSHFSSVAAPLLLNGTTKGTDVYNRIGRRLKIKSINIRGYVVFNGSYAGPAPDYMRAAIIYDREPGGALPTWSDIFQDTTNAGAAAGLSTSPLNLNNTDRFAVLKDWHWSVVGGLLNQATAPPGQTFPTATEMNIRWFKKLNLDVRYNSGNAGTIADLTTGAMYMVTQGLNSAANHQWDLNFTSRIRFEDA